MSEAITVASTQPDTAAAASQPQSSQSEPYQFQSSQPSSQPKKTAPKKQAASKAAASKPRSKRTPSEDRDNAYSIPSDAESDDLDFARCDNDATAEKRVFRERKPKAKTEESKLSGIYEFTNTCTVLCFSNPAIYSVLICIHIVTFLVPNFDITVYCVIW